MKQLYFGDYLEMIERKEIKMSGGVDQTTFKKATKDLRPEIMKKGDVCASDWHYRN